MKKENGVTLIELVITVAIVAILVSVAIPSYQRFVYRANRTAAMEAILESAACEERIYSRTGAYIFDDTCITTPDGYAKLAIANLIAGQGFRIVATPAGVQAGDKCNRLRLDHTGAKTVSGASKTAAQCWAGR